MMRNYGRSLHENSLRCFYVKPYPAHRPTALELFSCRKTYKIIMTIGLPGMFHGWTLLTPKL